MEKGVFGVLSQMSARMSSIEPTLKRGHILNSD